MVRSYYDPSKLARNVGSVGTEDYYGSRDGASPFAPSHGKSPTAAPRRPRWSYPSYHVLWPPLMVMDREMATSPYFTSYERCPPSSVPSSLSLSFAVWSIPLRRVLWFISQ